MLSYKKLNTLIVGVLGASRLAKQRCNKVTEFLVYGRIYCSTFMANDSHFGWGYIVSVLFV
jgi:hypothetical protein